jgi:hypothetical protein
MKRKPLSQAVKENILARLANFEKLERRATDQVGWIALAYGVTRRRAAQMINEAQGPEGHP